MRFWRPVLSAVVGLLVGVLVVMMVALTVRTADLTDAIRQTQKTNTTKSGHDRETLALIQRIARQIESCTTPSEPCAKRGQRATAKAVGDINRVVILASACAIGIDPKEPIAQRQSQITMCVLNRLARETPR